MKKRSVSITGHRTSISLEEEFWDLLKRSAAKKDRSLASLIAEIDANRVGQTPTCNLSSALRLYILKELQNSANAQSSTSS